MQLAKTSGALALHAKAGLPYLSVLTHPTTAGVMASYASLGDVIIAEPKALIGFAGPRVIKETTQQELPEGFQTSEFLRERGLIDHHRASEATQADAGAIAELFFRARRAQVQGGGVTQACAAAAAVRCDNLGTALTYPETIEYLYGIRLFGQKLGLETMQYLLRLMGDPQKSLRFIHIAGTNGKGSVAAMLSAVLSTAGYKTGLYTSPHLVSFCERFQINGQPIAEVRRGAAASRRSSRCWRRWPRNPEFRAPTFFEAVTAIALRYFAEQNVDVVVWETGLGGRLDATNVIVPLVSVITNIAFDHTQYLGETLAQIATEKCGIIKPGVPVVTAAATEEALQVIRSDRGGARAAR